MSKEIYLDAPSVGTIEKEYLSNAIDSGFVSSVGPFISQFEKKMADLLKIKGTVAVQSGTAAIYVALYELGIKAGDEVIVPSLTFAATVNPILYLGATPVIVDVDPKTWNIDSLQIKKAITPQTRAIIPVHLYGNPCSMTEIMRLAQEHHINVIEDATESLGASYEGHATGSFGQFGCFSFNGNKLITTGGGGMIVSNKSERIEHIRYLINQAKDDAKPGFHEEMGFNFRMTNIEAALGLAQIEKIDVFMNKRKIFYEIYEEILGKMPGICFQKAYDKASHSRWLTCISIEKKISIIELMRSLLKHNIPTRRIFMPVHEMPYLKKYALACPHASHIYEQGICLPCSSLNEEQDIKQVALKIREVLTHA